ncbi:hypothetical protein TrVE_jg8850 [Triparma verrucosa]|uniref:Uncharacterized protein n=1 Tax=Triparma verrucosa TaxID=1606542 RepID=A0A9W7FPM4_9STRA|nr:hypothetical protein TrVE_jg8850 [Triparma verrucosa]
MKFTLATIFAALATSVNAFVPTAFLPRSLKLDANSGYECVSPPPDAATFDQIDDLLVERNEARFARDYDAADDIRDLLKRDFNVHVYDKFKEFEIVENRGRGGNNRGRDNYNAPGNPQNQWDFGPLGHDYERAPDDTAELSEDFVAEINDLIRLRLEAKLKRNFQEADSIQNQLEADFRVLVHDGRKQWRGDDGDFNKYQRQGVPGDDEPADLDSIVTAMLAERTEAKMVRDYDVADRIKDELREKYNVMVDDKKKSWVVGYDNQSDRGRQWFRGCDKKDDEDENFESQVMELVEERNKAKISRNYDAADDILATLQEDFGVYCNDRERSWTVGPNYPKYKRAQFDRPGEDEDENFEQTVNDLVAERSAAKYFRDFDTADDIRDDLSRDFDVFVDDKQMLWKIGKFEDRGRGGGGGRGGFRGGVSETSLSLESESHHTYSQNGPLVRHRGCLLGFIAGVELSALDRKNAKSNKQTKASSNQPTPPPSWRDSLNSLSSSFTAALNSPDPIKTLAQGNVAPAPPLQSPTPSATPPKRKTSLQQVKSLLTPSLKVYPQITPDDLKSRLEVYFLRLYGCNHITANLLDGKVLKKIQSSVVKVAVKGVVKSFLATVSATTSPTLLLHSHIVAMCREALAVVEISREIETVVKYTIARIEADLDGNQTSTEDKSGGSSQGEGEEKLPSQIKSFLKSPKIADKFLRVENMFASKFDDAEVVSKCMSGHLKSLLEYLSEADNSTQLVMSSYGERMLSRGIEPSLRNEFKDGDFESETALKSAYEKFHKQFKSIRLPPSDNFMCVNLVKHLSEEKEKAKGSAKYSEQSMMQALKDLKRERIFVNGREVVDRKVTSKRELVKVLTEAIEKGVVNPKPDKKATSNNLLDESLLASESDYSTGFSSAPDNDTSNKESGDSDCRRRRGDPNEKVIARPRKFDTSKLTEIVSRILLASSRTGSGGDTLLFLNDLFGGDEVVLRPSSNENMQAAIEIDVYAGRVDIVCKAFYTVYLREDLEAPMLYLRGKMVERIPLFVQRVEGGELGDVELKEVERVEGEDEGYEFGRVLKINMAAPTIEAKAHENINTPIKTENKVEI